MDKTVSAFLAEFAPRRYVFLPVIHVESQVQALRNVHIAYEEGANGVFLINHRIKSKELIRIYHEIRIRYHYWWIGLNFLDKEPIDAVRVIPADANALWLDDLGVRENVQYPSETSLAQLISDKLRSRFSGSLFGGLAFKYQPEVRNLREMTRASSAFATVLTTSGEATGSPPPLEKLRTIRQVVGEYKPLAIASGMTPKNVQPYLRYANCFMVATGISRSEESLDPQLVAKMRKAIPN